MPSASDWEADWRHFVQTSVPGRIRQPGMYLDLQAAEASLNWLADHRIGVLGVEGFEWLDDNSVRPSLSHIADWSALWTHANAFEESLRETRALLTKWTGQIDLVDLALQPAAVA